MNKNVALFDAVAVNDLLYTFLVIFQNRLRYVFLGWLNPWFVWDSTVLFPYASIILINTIDIIEVCMEVMNYGMLLTERLIFLSLAKTNITHNDDACSEKHGQSQIKWKLWSWYFRFYGPTVLLKNHIHGSCFALFCCALLVTAFTHIP